MENDKPKEFWKSLYVFVAFTVQQLLQLININIALTAYKTSSTKTSYLKLEVLVELVLYAVNAMLIFGLYFLILISEE